MIVDKNVKVSKSAEALTASLTKLTKVTKEQLKDGFQPGADLPPLTLAAFQEFQQVLAAIPQLDDEAKEDVFAFSRGVLNGAVDIAEAAVKG